MTYFIVGPWLLVVMSSGCADQRHPIAFTKPAHVKVFDSLGIELALSTKEEQLIVTHLTNSVWKKGSGVPPSIPDYYIDFHAGDSLARKIEVYGLRILYDDTAGDYCIMDSFEDLVAHLEPAESSIDATQR
ncbi:hypothetical protein [Stieleria varia]|nr:hypothetical protein [Stieleria varia]